MKSIIVSIFFLIGVTTSAYGGRCNLVLGLVSSPDTVILNEDSTWGYAETAASSKKQCYSFRFLKKDEIISIFADSHAKKRCLGFGSGTNANFKRDQCATKAIKNSAEFLEKFNLKIKADFEITEKVYSKNYSRVTITTTSSEYIRIHN